MNPEELLNQKRDEIFDHWTRMKNISDEFENHPSRQ